MKFKLSKMDDERFPYLITFTDLKEEKSIAVSSAVRLGEIISQYKAELFDEKIK